MELQSIQKLVCDFTKEKGINTEVSVRALDLVSEVGELSKEILKGTNYGIEEFKVTEGFKSEVGDVLFALICLANEAKIDLEESLKAVIAKYEGRFASKGHLGSDK